MRTHKSISTPFVAIALLVVTSGAEIKPQSTRDIRKESSFDCSSTNYTFMEVESPSRTKESDPCCPSDLNIVVANKTVATVALTKESEAKNLSFNSATRTPTGFQIDVDWGGGLDHYEIQFKFQCRQNQFYLYEVKKDSFSTSNPESGNFLDKKKTKITRIKPSLPINKFVMTDYL